MSPSPSTTTCGVLAGVGARSWTGDGPGRPNTTRNGGRSPEESLLLTNSASSSTFCSRVFTWPLSRASPDPGVFFIAQTRFLTADEDGVFSLARPTMGESLVMSRRADLSVFPMALDLEKESSFLLFSVKTQKERRKTRVRDWIEEGIGVEIERFWIEITYGMRRRFETV